MKLIKINPDHYVIVDDSKMVEGDYGIMDEENFEIFRCSVYMFPNGYTTPIIPQDSKKITHSTKPIESINVINSIRKGYDKVQPLSLSEVKELLGYYIGVEKAKKYVGWFDDNDNRDVTMFLSGYDHAIYDNKDRKYTEEDMRVAIRLATTSKYDHILEFYTEEEILKSLQPTQWDVEFINGKLKLK